MSIIERNSEEVVVTDHFFLLIVLYSIFFLTFAMNFRTIN